MSSAEAHCRDEAQGLVRALAGPSLPAGGAVKAAIREAARRLGWSYDKARRYWYGRVRVIPAHEMDQLRAEAARLDAMRAQALARRAEISARLEAHP